MADLDQSQFSLMSLEDELTCSICLSTFDCPVTLPCGHNFCQDCLQAHWKDSYSCPQCRTLFPTKPELKKNTVLSTVVKTFNLRSYKPEQVTEEVKEAKKDDIIRCDTCMEAEASKTCLTCMASFCEEHLRPHRENPKFSVHQLCELGELSEQICPDHNKMMEFFCSEHKHRICSLCLQQVHKGCPFTSPEEHRNQKETDFRDKLDLLEAKINRTETVLFQMKDMQSKLKDASATKKTALASMYRQMQEMLAAEEHEAQYEVDHELEFCQKKLQDFMGRFTENAEKMKKAREEINSLLSQSQSPAFLQASFDLPKVVNFDPYPPRISLDSKKVIATQACAAILTEILKQPAEVRLQTLQPGEKAEPVSGSEKIASAQREPGPPEHRRPPRSHSRGRPPIGPVIQPVHGPVYMPRSNRDTSPYTPSPAPHREPHFNPGPKPNKQSEFSHRPPYKHERKPPGGGKQGPTWSHKPQGHPSSGKP